MGQQDAITVMATDTVSDGYHTFGELYDHRITLWVTMCRLVADAISRDQQAIYGREIEHESRPWRSKAHHPKDQPMYESWFVLGVGKEIGLQITYHLPLSRWDECNFAETLEHAPKWDGHTPQDTLERLKKL